MGLYFIHHISNYKHLKILIRNHARYNMYNTDVCLLAYYTVEAQCCVSTFRCCKSGSSERNLTLCSGSIFSLCLVHIQTRGHLAMNPGPQVGYSI